jgi:hypothetical protein
MQRFGPSCRVSVRSRRCCAAPALAVRGPLPRGGKTGLAHTLAMLAVAASTDACGRQMPGAQMRRWPREIYADHRGRTRRAESLRPFSGYAVRRLAPRASAVQHRHGAPPTSQSTPLQAPPLDRLPVLIMFSTLHGVWWTDARCGSPCQLPKIPAYSAVV